MLNKLMNKKRPEGLAVLSPSEALLSKLYNYIIREMDKEGQRLTN